MEREATQDATRAPVAILGGQDASCRLSSSGGRASDTASADLSPAASPAVRMRRLMGRGEALGDGVWLAVGAAEIDGDGEV